MIVVSDTSPINYLILIRQIDVLAALFERIIIPRAVVSELLAAKAPAPVKDWVLQPPAWFVAQDISVPTASSLNRLGAGEAEAITLALESGAGLLLIDEREGREAATQRGLKVTGTLGILDLAEKQGLVDFKTAVASLMQTTFRASKPLIESILEQRPGVDEVSDKDE
jgi:predicted nucleic acid-binding protein